MWSITCVPLVLFVFRLFFVEPRNKCRWVAVAVAVACSAFIVFRVGYRCFFTRAFMRASNDGVVIGVFGS